MNHILAKRMSLRKCGTMSLEKAGNGGSSVGKPRFPKEFKAVGPLIILRFLMDWPEAKGKFGWQID